MKNLIKKRIPFFSLFIFIVPHALYASQSIHQPSEQVNYSIRQLSREDRKLLVNGYSKKYNLPKDIFLLIVYFVNDYPLQYKNKPLPRDLSGQDLNGYDFTGCQFTYTDLTDTNLENTILTNTTCDYQKAFLNNFKENKCEDGNWYKNSLPKDLKSIANVYPKLNNHANKIKLLHIACGLSRLPFYTNLEIYIKSQYWSCALLQLKNNLGDPYGKEIVCSYESYLNDDAKNYCWSTKYLQNDVHLDEENPHDNFGTYLTSFNNGLVKYKCESKYSDGFGYYKKEIQKNIKGLQKAYPKINNKELQKEACQIGCALSKSYQFQKMPFLFHYLFYQHRLIRFKNLVGSTVKSDIHYSFNVTFLWKSFFG